MSNIVDKRVVEMQFDNKQFESGIQTSVKSLDKLKESLNLEESANGLDSLQKAGKRFSLDNLVDAAEAVTSKFSIMGTVGDQVMRRITDAIFNAYNGMRRLVSSFTTEPIRTGFSEYETQTNAIQTILANTSDAMDKLGYSQQERLDVVNKKLDELNQYADKTIYNFTEMTRNIGTFTAAGVELNTAVASIQGIANLAAVSGSTSEQASRAMYQLSQAISTGTLRLLDWNSVVNAGMGGEVFQKALLRTARAMGVVGEKQQEAYAAVVAGNMSFRDSLSSGWLTSDILTATLEQISWDFETLAESMGKTVEEVKELKKADLLASGYTLEETDAIIALAETATDAATKVKTFSQLLDTLKEAAQSGWTQTWEYIIGDFGEAKELLTEISKYFGALIDGSSDARNTIVKEWKDLGGRSELIESFWNIIHALQNIIGTTKSAFQSIFPPATGKRLMTITQKFNGITESFKAFTENADNMEVLRKAVRGIASVLDIVRSGLCLVGRGFKLVFRMAGSFFGVFARAANAIGDFIRRVKSSISSSEEFQTILTKLCEAGEAMREMFGKGIGYLSESLNKLGSKIKNSKVISDIGDELMYFVSLIPAAIDGLINWIRTLETTIRTSERLQTIWAGVKNFFAPVVKGIKEFASLLRDAFHAFNSADVSGEENMFGRLKIRLEAFAGVFRDWLPNIRRAANTSWDGIKQFFTAFFKIQIPKFFQSKTFSGEHIAARLSSIDWGKVLKIVLGGTALLRLGSAMKTAVSFRKVLKTLSGTLGDLGKTLKDVGKNGLEITKINKDSIGTTLLKIAGAIAVLVGSIYLLSKMDDGDVVKGMGVITFLAVELLAASAIFGKIRADGKNFLMVAASVSLLAIPIKILGSMDTAQAWKGIGEIGAILLELGLFMRLAGKGFANKTAFISLAIGLNLMVLAMKGMANMNWTDLGQGLIGMLFMLTELWGFIKLTGGVGKVNSILTIAIAMNLLVLAVKGIGKLDTATWAKGVVGLGAIMLAFGAMIKLSKGMKIGKTFALLLTLTGTLIIFSETFKQIADIDSKKMLSFAISVSTTILALSVAMRLVSAIPFSAAMLGLGSLLIWISALGAFITVVGVLSQKWSGFSDYIEEGGNILGLIGEAIGKFVGGIGRGIYKGFDLPGLGTELSEFMKNAEVFLSGVGSLNTAGFDKLCDLANAVKNIAKAGVKHEKITKAVDNFRAIGDGLGEYIASVEGVITAKSFSNMVISIEAAKMLADTLSTLSHVRFGVINEFPEAIATIASGLNGYSESVKGFSSSNAASEYDLQLAILVAQNLAELMVSLPETGGLLQKIIGFKDLGSFSTNIENVGRALRTYSSSIKGFSGGAYAASEADLSLATSAAKNLSDLMNSLPETGGWLQKVIGFKDLEGFSEGIKKVGEALKAYSKTIKGFSGGENSATEEDLQLATQVAKNLSELMNSLPKTGGTLQEWIGWKDLSLFSTNIEMVGKSLVSYSNSVKGFSNYASEEDLKLANTTAMALSRLNSSLPPTGSTLQKWLFGEQDLDLFATNIVILGTSLKAFAESIAGVDMIKSETAVNVMDVIKTFVDGLEGSGSVWDTLNDYVGSGNKIQTLTSYTQAMRKVGSDLNAFSMSMENVSVDKVTAAQTVISAVQTFLFGLESEGSVWQWFGDKFGSGSVFDTLKTIVEAMANLGTSIKTFVDGTTGIEYSVDRLATIQALFESMKALTEYTESIGNVDLTPIQTLLDSFSKLVIPEFDTEGVAAANAYLDALDAGIQNGDSSLTIVVVALSKSGVDAANGTYQSWYAAGQYLGQGLGDGIASMAATVNAQAVSVAAGAINSISVTWQVNSPSKVGTSLGMFFDLGIARGFDRYSSAVNHSAEKMSQSAANSARTLLRGASSSLFDDIDPNPTIRPVIDLSGVRSGVDSISSMFNSNSMVGTGLFKGLNFSKSVNALNFDGSKILGGLNNKDVVSELKTLSDHFDNLADAVANMELVLDSGELVGRTSAKMDTQLGTLDMRRRRGN